MWVCRANDCHPGRHAAAGEPHPARPEMHNACVRGALTAYDRAVGSDGAARAPGARASGGRSLPTHERSERHPASKEPRRVSATALPIRPSGTTASPTPRAARARGRALGGAQAAALPPSPPCPLRRPAVPPSPSQSGAHHVPPRLELDARPRPLSGNLATKRCPRLGQSRAWGTIPFPHRGEAFLGARAPLQAPAAAAADVGALLLRARSGKPGKAHLPARAGSPRPARPAWLPSLPGRRPPSGSVPPAGS